MIDTAPSFLQGLLRRIPSDPMMGALVSKGKILLENRTLEGKDESGAAFGPYKTKPYYAPVDGRPPGYPAPTGGEPSKSGKTMKYDSYASYKSAMGFGATPQLSISNEMLSDIGWIVKSKTRALMFFTSRLSAAKAHKHHTGDYPFFGFGDMNTITEMNEELVQQFRDARRVARAEIKARRSRSR
jgi:hypothetical protein